MFWAWYSIISGLVLLALMYGCARAVHRGNGPDGAYEASAYFLLMILWCILVGGVAAIIATVRYFW